MKMSTQEQAAATIEMARRHVAQATMRSSAELCLADAEALYGAQDFLHALIRANCSLDYSIGKWSPLRSL